MIFVLLSLAVSAFEVFMAYVCAVAPQRFASLPRNVRCGVALGVPCLVWAAWHACVMLEGGLARFHVIVWLLVPTIAVLAYFFLDYLFARALGGFFILAANEIIHGAFTYDIPLRPLFSVVCLILGIVGLFMLGTPWNMRDAIQHAASNRKHGKWMGTAFAFGGVVVAALSIPALWK